jgi:hypothetical protein
MRAIIRVCLPLLLAALLSASCRSSPEEQDARLRGELGFKVSLWVETECTKSGKTVFKDYSVLKLPDEKVVWTIAKIENDCRVYGAIVKKNQKQADLCDIRFRSKLPIVAEGKCRCVAGRFDLEEGRPTSKRCCEKYPDKVYCKPEPGAEQPATEPQVDTPLPDATPGEKEE